jgi:nucleoid DNA-binding protein
VYKYESYLKEALLRETEISLAQIGVFTLTKESFLPEGASSSTQKINFLYNKKAETSEPLISFIAEKQKKNLRIVALDLESYLNEVRQLINTGKELRLEGLGHLLLNMRGEYEFVQQSAEPAKNDDSAKKKKQRNDKYAETTTKKNTRRSGTSSLMIIFVFLLAAAAVWGIYFLVSKNNDTTDVSQNNDAVIHPDTTLHQNIAQPADSISKKAIVSPANNTDSVSYKFIFETTKDSARANARLAKLKVYGDPAALDIVRTDSGLLYRLFLVKKILPADSTAAKDSVQNYFQRNVIIEKVIK